MGKGIFIKLYNFHTVSRNETVHFEDQELFAGYVCPRAKPHRDNTVENGKWKISIEEYNYNYYPPFISAGAYVMSRYTMKTMYLATHFVKHFIFDDIYFGIVAKKCGIKLFKSNNFLVNPHIFYPSDKKFVIAAHLRSNLETVENLWRDQVKLGNA